MEPEANSSQVQAHRPRQRWIPRAARALTLVMVIAITGAVLSLADRMEHLGSLGYAGAFGVMLLGNSTVVLPAPGLAVVFALGSALDPVLVGLAGGAGAALGELTGYAAGLSGRAVIENRPIYQRFEQWMKRYGTAALLTLAIAPNPFFDIAGLIAGALRYSWRRFLLITWAGKTIQGILVACAGAASAEWVLNWIH